MGEETMCEEGNIAYFHSSGDKAEQGSSPCPLLNHC